MIGKILARNAEGALQEFPLAAGVRVGSGPPSDLVIEGDGVLPEHAKVDVTAQGCWIEAVGGSRVSVNGEPADRRALRHLDVITLGDHVHAIFLTSSVSRPQASRHTRPVPPAASKPSRSSSETVFGLPVNALFTPPVEEPPAAAPHKTVFGVPVGDLFTPPAEDRAASTVAGLPLSALRPPAFNAPPSETVRMSPIRPPSFAPDHQMHPIRSVRLDAADGVYELPLGVSVIGRGAKATVRLDSVKISRVHAVVVVSRDQVTIDDQGSSNGTSVNGVRINGRQVLADGDVVSVGSFDLRLTVVRGGE